MVQSELADRAGYSESAVAMVESYQRPPTKTFAKAMDKAFGTPARSTGWSAACPMCRSRPLPIVRPARGRGDGAAHVRALASAGLASDA